MKKIAFLFLFSSVLFLTFPLTSYSQGSGGEPLSIFRYPIGAKSISLGGADLVPLDDVTSVLINPANMIISKDMIQVGVGYTRFPFERHNSHFGFIYTDPEEYGWGIGVGGIFSYSTEEFNQYDPVAGTVTPTHYDNYAWLGQISFGMKFDDLGTQRLGIGIKAVSQTLDGATAYGGALDVVFNILVVSIIDVSVMVSDIGAVQWDSREDPEFIHPMLKVGIGLTQFESFSISIQLNKDLLTYEWPDVKAGLWFMLYQDEPDFSVLDLPLEELTALDQLGMEEDETFEDAPPEPTRDFENRSSRTRTQSKPNSIYINIGYNAGSFCAGFTFFFWGINLDIAGCIPNRFTEEWIYTASLEYKY